MDAVIINVTVGADRRLTLDLPPNMPIGEVKVTVEPIATTPAEPIPTDGEKQPLTREEAKRRLEAAGMRFNEHYAPEGAVRSSPEENARLARLFSDEKVSVLDMVNEDRGPKG